MDREPYRSDVDNRISNLELESARLAKELREHCKRSNNVASDKSGSLTIQGKIAVCVIVLVGIMAVAGAVLGYTAWGARPITIAGQAAAGLIVMTPVTVICGLVLGFNCDAYWKKRSGSDT